MSTAASPLLRAVPIQFAALLAAAALALASAGWIADSRIRLGLALAGAATVAWTLATRWRQPPGWRWLHAAALPGVVLALHLGLPPHVYAIGFLLCFLLFGATFRSRVPLWLSGRRVHAAVADWIAAQGATRVLDAGAGIGGLVATLSRPPRRCRVEGCEWALLPWALGWLRLRLGRREAGWRWGSFWACDFAAYDLVFAYLSPAPMTALWDKARREMRPGSWLLSYRFPVEDVEPTRCIALGGGADRLWIYRIPPR